MYLNNYSDNWIPVPIWDWLSTYLTSGSKKYSFNEWLNGPETVFISSNPKIIADDDKSSFIGPLCMPKSILGTGIQWKSKYTRDENNDKREDMTLYIKQDLWNNLFSSHLTRRYNSMLKNVLYWFEKTSLCVHNYSKYFTCTISLNTPIFPKIKKKNLKFRCYHI